MYVWIVVADHLEIAPKERMVSDIEPDDRCVQPNIGLGQMLTKDERAFALVQDLFHPVQVLEDCRYVFFICFLCGCETGLSLQHEPSSQTKDVSTVLYLPCTRRC